MKVLIGIINYWLSSIINHYYYYLLIINYNLTFEWAVIELNQTILED